MADPSILGLAASYVNSQTGALVACVAALATLAVCFAWIGRKVGAAF